jgi:hypothetical protein
MANPPRIGLRSCLEPAWLEQADDLCWLSPINREGKIGTVFSGLKEKKNMLAQHVSDLNNSLPNQCLHGLVDRLKRTKSWTIIQQALRLGDARVGTVGYVIPC